MYAMTAPATIKATASERNAGADPAANKIGISKLTIFTLFGRHNIMTVITQKENRRVLQISIQRFFSRRPLNVCAQRAYYVQSSVQLHNNFEGDHS
jgi:hypothetical protein